MPGPRVRLGSEVEEARRAGTAVVALESTIVAHGMPWPRNLETALELEAAVRAGGAVPATVAVLGGEMCAGLELPELERIARGGQAVRKVSRRDLPVAVAEGEDGATTVAATMIIAALAGIEVFATGGIGGVHRGAGDTFDVSADLDELARTSVVVVAAGAKSILDLPATLEMLETRGVPVLGWGTDEFPAFFTRHSGLPVDRRVHSIEQLARIVRTKWDMGLAGGVLVANPIAPEHEPDPDGIDAAIVTALEEARRQGISGKHITPFLLRRVDELSGGVSLDANVALVVANARLAAQLAVELGGQPTRTATLPK
jgi:pseudouridine-5'-phosphate glycosidase